MKQTYPPQVLKPLHCPLKRLTVFLFFFLLLAAGVKGQVTSITCPTDPILGPCTSQADIEIAFSIWASGFSFTGGSNPSDNLANIPTFSGSEHCNGSSLSFTYIVTDDFGSSSCKSTFTVGAPSAVAVTGPANVDESSCVYADQDELNAAFEAWIAVFEVTEDGCGVTTPDLIGYTAPVLCTGGEVSVTYAVEDLCTSAIITRTFKITAPPAVAVTGPANVDASSCDYADQAALDAAFATWLNGFEVSGGCVPQFDNGSPTAPAFCGGSTTVTWTVSDQCYTPTTHQATFTITAPPAVVVTPVTSSSVTSCTYTDQASADAAFATWLNGFEVSGGCVPQFDNGSPTAPNFCGGSTIVTWTVTDQCYATTTYTATFTITEAQGVELTVPSNYTGTTCMTQIDVNTDFSNWLAQVDYSGGCGSSLTTVPENPTPPSFCGGSINVQWIVKNGCSSDVIGSSIFSIPQPSIPQLIPPANFSLENPISQGQIDSSFYSWLEIFNSQGGCGSFVSITPLDSQPPGLCGGTTTVTWTLTSQCHAPISVTRTFSVARKTYISAGSGEWTDPDNWQHGCIPPYQGRTNNFQIIIQEGDSITLDGSLNFGNRFLLTVCGYLEIGKNFVGGEEEGGNLEGNALDLYVCCGATLKINGDIEIKNVADLDVNGTLIVGAITGFNPQTNCIYSSDDTCEEDGLIIREDFYAPNVTGFSLGGDPGSGPNANCTAQGGVVLPVKLLSFTSQIKPDHIELLWTTGTEINNDYFTLERSRDAYGWEVLGFVQGAGNSSVPLSYSFSDLQPLDGLAYYRLKQTDFDGQFKYYGPIAAHYDLGLEGLDFKVLKQYSNWIIAVPQDGIYQVEVYTLTGRRLVSEKTENTLTIPAPEGGVVIRVTDGYARSASRVVM